MRIAENAGSNGAVIAENVRLNHLMMDLTLLLENM